MTRDEAEFGFIMAAVKEEMYGCDLHYAEVSLVCDMFAIFLPSSCVRNLRFVDEFI